MAKTATGQQKVWQLLETIGKGDAGEVLRVQTELGRDQGVMKRPVQNVSGGTIVRQAKQIENEGRVLALLAGLDVERHGRKIHTPLLMDQSPEGTSSTANLFIVSEEVSGVSVSELLKRRLQGSTPISQVLLLKVLAGTFQLLAKVHEKGVIWNDVKMDHIFWNADTNTLSFIDWGNSLFLTPDQGDSKANIMLDYQQLLEEGRALLEQTSPELIPEIGWPFSSAKLGDLEITHLQMRVEYMETYLSMRIIEYKLLFSRYLKSLDSLDGLKQTLDLTRALRQLGVEVDSGELLTAAKVYLLDLLGKGQPEEAAEAFGMLQNALNSSLPPGWQLAGYLLNQYGMSEPNALVSLITSVLDSNWTAAAWTYNKDFLSENSVTTNYAVINSMRNLQLNSKPYPLISDDLTQLAQQGEGWLTAAVRKNLDADSVNALRALNRQIYLILQTWSRLEPGEKLGEKFLLLRQALERYNNFGLRPTGQLQNSMMAAMAKIREIYRAWAACDLAKAQKQTCELFLLEPSLFYLTELDDDLGKMVNWLNRIEEGPSEDQAANHFAAEALASLPPLVNRLSETGWLNTILHALDSIEKAQSIETLREEATRGQWPMPWLAYQSVHLDMPKTIRDSIRLSDEQKTYLSEYHQALKVSQKPTAALIRIRHHLPAFHQSYSDLASRFSTLFSQLPSDDPLPSPSNFPPEDQEAVYQALEALEAIRHWKRHIQSGSPDSFAFSGTMARQWLIVSEIQNQTERWNKQILPGLTEIKRKRWEGFQADQFAGKTKDSFAGSGAALAQLQLYWKRILEQGLYQVLIEDMIYQIDTAQTQFFGYWQSLQRSENVVTRWLSGIFQGHFSEINQNLLQIARRMRNVELAYSVVNQPEMARTRMAQNSAGDLMFNLVQLDDLIMPPTRKASVMRQWQQQYLDLLKTGDRARIVERIQTIETIHPLLPWFDELVRRDADYFDLPKSYQW